MRILIDMDNTICDWDEPIFKQLPELDRSKYKSWDIYSCYPGYGSEIDRIIYSSGFYRNLTPLKNAIECVKILSETNEIYFLTATPSKGTSAFTEKADWIVEHFGEDYLQKLMLVYRKDLVQGDILIDDKPNIENDICTWKQILYSSEYNNGTFTWSLDNLNKYNLI